MECSSAVDLAHVVTRVSCTHGSARASGRQNNVAPRPSASNGAIVIVTIVPLAAQPYTSGNWGGVCDAMSGVVACRPTSVQMLSNRVHHCSNTTVVLILVVY